MSGPRAGPALVLLALCAMAVVALAVGVQLYRSMLPPEAELSGATASLLGVTIGLLAALAGAGVWLLRRRRPSAGTKLDRRLWEAVGGGPEEDRNDR